MHETLAKMTARYESGRLPWHRELPPPEVIAWVQQAKAGRALDLGCGVGRAARFLAKHGWEVDAVDIVPKAIEMAIAESAEFPQIRYHIASVIDLHFLTPPYTFALDVGCGHSLHNDNLLRYRNEVARLLNPGSTFLVYGRLRLDNDPEAFGFIESELFTTFEPCFTLQVSEHGTTTVESETWTSAWYWWQRNDAPFQFHKNQFDPIENSN